jgi:hypothetical protein
VAIVRPALSPSTPIFTVPFEPAGSTMAIFVGRVIGDGVDGVRIFSANGPATLTSS